MTASANLSRIIRVTIKQDDRGVYVASSANLKGLIAVSKNELRVFVPRSRRKSSVGRRGRARCGRTERSRAAIPTDPAARRHLRDRWRKRSYTLYVLGTDFE